MFFKFVLLGLLITVLLFIMELSFKNRKNDYQNHKRYEKQDKELEVK